LIPENETFNGLLEGEQCFFSIGWAVTSRALSPRMGMFLHFIAK
jgi:hypothetical protein